MAALNAVLRATRRIAQFPNLVLYSYLDYQKSARKGSLQQRVEWLQRVAKNHLKWIEVELSICGKVPSSGLIVSNHLSYLDIVVLSHLLRCAFVSKSEVARWPIFGGYARRGATIFVDRQRKTTVAETATQMRQILEAGIPLVLFPEGTSSCGDSVLPFKTPLFEPVATLQLPVTPVAIHYELSDGNAGQEVCYWGDMTLLPHLGNLLSKKVIRAGISFGEPHPPGRDRKIIARRLHQSVSMLHSQLRGH